MTFFINNGTIAGLYTINYQSTGVLMTIRSLHYIAVYAVILCAGIVVVLDSSSGSPPADQLASSLGKSIYEAKCVECHGADGKGDGPAAGFLSPRPRNFTDGKFKFRSTESGSIPTDEDLTNTVQNGLHGTAMPDWKPFLNTDSLNAVIGHVKSFSARFTNEQPKPVKIGNALPSLPSSIAEGKKVFEKLQCAGCHGADGKGANAVATGLMDDWGHEIKATNLIEPWTFRGGSTPKDIYLRFRTGIDGSPMPSYIGSASETEMWNLANYVLSLARKPVWSMNEQEINEHYASLSKENPVERGRYLVNTRGCAFCHSPVKEDGSIMEEFRFAGGQKFYLFPYGDYITRNLTSDKETGLGSWTDDEIKGVLTKGTKRDGTRMLPFPMPWPTYAGMPDEDLNAIIAYLRTLPAVHNEIPQPKRPNIFAYLWGKFQMLILKKDVPSQIYPGNAGTAKAKTMSDNLEPAHQHSKEAQQ